MGRLYCPVALYASCWRSPYSATCWSSDVKYDNLRASLSIEQQEQTISPIRRMEIQERQWFTFRFLSFSFWLCIGVCSLLARQEWEASIWEREKFGSCTNLMMVELLSLCLPKPFCMWKGKKKKINVTVDSWLFIAQYWSVHSDYYYYYYYCVTSCSISVQYHYAFLSKRQKKEKMQCDCWILLYFYSCMQNRVTDPSWETVQNNK